MKQETLEQIVSKQFQKEFNKEVGKVLVQELKKKEMKQTAVEWLYKNLLENPISNQDVEYNEAVFHNAKEMEKQQQGYSEEDVLIMLSEIRKGSMVISSINNRTYWEFDIKSTKEWFEQFKNK